MKKTLHLLVFVLALATAIAVAQTSSSGTSTQSQPSTSSDQGTAAPPASQDVNHDKAKNNAKTKASVDDDTLNRQIKDQLSSDAAMKNVQANVSNGVVNLEGTVGSKADKKRAKQMVASIPGVRKVHDRLKVEATATVSPGSNEPASASAGTTGATTSSTTTNTAGSIAGNAGASSTTPQVPSASASTSTTTTRESAPASGMPQSDVSTGANAGISGSGTQTQSTTGVSGTSSQTQSSTGVSGTTSTTTPQSSATGTAGVSGTTGTTSTTEQSGAVSGTTTGSTELQTQCETALQREPTLASNHINCVVSGDTIELSGSVATGKERQTALRIANSYAGNRRVVDRLTVTGRGQGANMGGENSSRPETGATPNSNPSSTPSNPNASPDSTNNPRR